MSPKAFRRRAFLLDGCPFSFRFWLFALEAGLAHDMEIVRVSPTASDSEALKRSLGETLGRPATFPTVEVEPGVFMTESNDLIQYYAQRKKVDVDALPALAFYSDTIFPQIVEFHRLLQQR